MAIGIVLNLMLYLVVIRPVTKLSKLADRVSLGELDAELCKFCVRLLHVVAHKGDAAEGANTVLMSLRREQHHSGAAV